MKKYILRALIVLAVAGAAWYSYRFFQQLPQRQQQVASTQVRQGDVIIRAFSRGELRAVRSATLTAPNLFGTVQVTRLAPMGSLAKEKDLVIEFDDSERRASLEETLLEVEQIDEQIKQKQAELAIRNNQDQVDLLRSRYSVRRAELEVKRNELLSEIDRKKNILNLEEARRRLKQLESDIKSRQEQAVAELAVLRENRNKSMIDVARENQRIAQTKMLSPMMGLVALRQNRSSVMFFGQQLPDIREGDTLQPGMPVADILDLSEVEVVAKVGELDRANLHEGQDVVIELDAVSGKKFRGQIKGMSGTASANVWSGDPAKKFDVIFSIDMRQLLQELGAKPEAIERIMQTAALNAKKAPISTSSSRFASMGGMPGGMPGGMGGVRAGGEGGASGPMAVMLTPGGPGGPPGASGAGAQSGQDGERGGRMRMAGGMSDENRQKFRDAMQKALGGKNAQDLSPEERQKMFEKIRQEMGLPAGSGRPRGEGGERGGRGQRGEGGGRGEGGTAAPSPAEAPAFNLAAFAPSGMVGTEEERAKAKLPQPPEEAAQLDALLRPGLLADVEIIVEKIPNAVHIPNQAIFEREGKLVSFVKTGNRFEPREIQIMKRSESTVVLKSGLKPGEIVALSDPDAKKKDQKDEAKKGGGGAGMPGMSGSGGGGGGEGGGRRGGGR